MRLLILGLVFLTSLPAVVMAEKRMGLVIGNDAYADVPKLEKAMADASAVSAALSEQGYEITTLLNGTRRDMNRQISEFTHRLEPGDTAFVFFAGHGVEIDGENYLLPTDILAPSSGERDFIKSESIALSSLLDRIRATGARTTIAVIDACRDNPFATSTGRSIGTARGLGRISAPEGTFVIFSAAAGQMALDRLSESDTAANSVFTRLLLPRLRDPGLELRALMAGLRVDVRDLARTVGHDQFPAYYDELLGQFYFSGAAPQRVVQQAQEQPESSPIRADFALAQGVGTVEAYDAFLARYGGQEDDFTVQLARQLRSKLTTDEAAEPEASAAERVIVTAPREKRETEIVAVEELPKERREIIRMTQERLNALGCKAGKADGILGRRTRAAFGRFAEVNDTDLTADALGYASALRAVMADRLVACPVVVAGTGRQSPATGGGSGSAASSGASGGSGTAQAAPAAAPALSLAGTWSFSAKCALFIESKGTVRFRHVSGNFYQARISDNLGNKGTAEVYLNGRTINSTEYFPGVTNTFVGRLSPDGQSYSGSGSNTCAVYAQRR